MGKWSKILLSGSTAGQGIPVTGTTASQGTILHTGVTGGAGSIDEVYIFGWAATGGRTISIAIGPTTATGSRFSYTITGADDGLHQIVPGLPIQATAVVKAWATAADQFNVFGYVNRYVT